MVAYTEALAALTSISKNLRQAGLQMESQHVVSYSQTFRNKFQREVKWHPLNGDLQRLLKPCLEGAGVVAQLILHFGMLCMGKMLERSEVLAAVPGEHFNAATRPEWAKVFLEGVNPEGAGLVADDLKACLDADKLENAALDALLIPMLEVLLKSRGAAARLGIQDSYLNGLTGEQRPQPTPSSPTNIWSKSLPGASEEAGLANTYATLIGHKIKDSRTTLKGALTRFKTHKSLGMGAPKTGSHPHAETSGNTKVTHGKRP
jgi:hypothetical protein